MCLLTDQFCTVTHNSLFSFCPHDVPCSGVRTAMIYLSVKFLQALGYITVGFGLLRVYLLSLTMQVTALHTLMSLSNTQSPASASNSSGMLAKVKVLLMMVFEWTACTACLAESR